MRIGIVLIGDELLTGRRQDQHFAKVIEMLATRSLELSWGRIVGDNPEILTPVLRDVLSSGDLVFSFGGIGATPDDCTRQCAAAAAGVMLTRHPEAARIIEEKYGPKAYPQRIQMADFPAGSHIIPNPYNGIAGFSLGTTYFVPGFPQMAWPMVAWVLDTHYRHLHRAERPVQYLIRVYGVPESDMVPLMNRILAEYPEVKVSSLPHLAGADSHIEFGIRGLPAQAQAAAQAFRDELAQMQVRWEDAGQAGLKSVPE